MKRLFKKDSKAAVMIIILELLAGIAILSAIYYELINLSFKMVY